MNRTDAPDQLTLIDAPIPQPPARILVLRGTVNWWDETELHTAFARATTAGRPVIVDLGSLQAADAVLLALLLGVRTRTPLHLVGPLSPSLARRLDLTCTRDVFRIHANLAAALAAITAADARGETDPPSPGGD
ncbi:hypothetical protein [Streptomyces sp. NPDC058701]|uniref:hypothetical protein n=1 Tax=Streptomyces sp. NPDC058701 TaxID=3346608 RepID=UPI0036694878